MLSEGEVHSLDYTPILLISTNLTKMSQLCSNLYLAFCLHTEPCSLAVYLTKLSQFCPNPFIKPSIIYPIRCSEAIWKPSGSHLCSHKAIFDVTKLSLMSQSRLRCHKPVFDVKCSPLLQQGVFRVSEVPWYVYRSYTYYGTTLKNYLSLLHVTWVNTFQITSHQCNKVAIVIKATIVKAAIVIEAAIVIKAAIVIMAAIIEVVIVCEATLCLKGHHRYRGHCPSQRPRVHST